MLTLLFHFTKFMQVNNKKDNEMCGHPHHLQVAAISMQLSSQALQWLNDYTLNNANERVSNFSLLYEMLSRMRLDAGSDSSFRRSISLSSGQFQFSEEQLAADWNIGRKRVRGILAQMVALGIIAITSSRVASYASVVCATAWSEADGKTVRNPVLEAPQGAESSGLAER
jgi:hypothetical protein